MIIQIYYPGETVSGTVEFTLTEPKRYNSIKVDFLGGAKVRWSGWSRSIIGQEKYIKESMQLWNPEQSHCGTIGPGFFSFQFQFAIPSHVPSSFEFQGRRNASANISYKIEARAVSTGALQFDRKTSSEILIAQLISINGANQAAPVRQVKQKQVGCLRICCAAGNVEFVAKLPHTGYCVTNQDVIPLMVDVQNNSTRVISMKASILQQVELSVRNHHLVSYKSMSKISSDVVRPGATYIWNPTDWIVPPEIQPSLLGCRIIQADYFLMVSAVISHAVNLNCCIPLLLGNLPFDNIEDQW